MDKGRVLTVRQKVLVVEDDLDYRELIQHVLELKGFAVIKAENGREAIEIVERDRPDIILMDLYLPVLSGLEATRVIKNNPATSRIPILVISAYCKDLDIKE